MIPTNELDPETNFYKIYRIEEILRYMVLKFDNTAVYMIVNSPKENQDTGDIILNPYDNELLLKSFGGHGPNPIKFNASLVLRGQAPITSEQYFAGELYDTE